MKNWLRKIQVPSVPDDKEQRKDALSAATHNIRIVQNQELAVNAMKESMTQHTDRNHFIERLEWSYGLRR